MLFQSIFNLTKSHRSGTCYPTYILARELPKAFMGLKVYISFYQLTNQIPGNKSTVREAMKVLEILIQQRRMGHIVLSVHRSLQSLVILWFILYWSKHWLAEDQTTAVCFMNFYKTVLNQALLTLIIDSAMQSFASSNYHLQSES